jgi:hypothetical protein
LPQEELPPDDSLPQCPALWRLEIGERGVPASAGQGDRVKGTAWSMIAKIMLQQ